jgi:hypothetical protein
MSKWVHMYHKPCPLRVVGREAVISDDKKCKMVQISLMNIRSDTGNKSFKSDPQRKREKVKKEESLEDGAV